MPEACTAPSKPVANRLDALAPVQGQESLGTIRDPLGQVAIREQGFYHVSIGFVQAIRQWFTSLHPTPSLPY
jgi:hypothetical protein